MALRLTFQPLPVPGVNGTVRYTGNFTDFNYQIDTGGAPIIDPAGYNKFEAWLGVRVFY